MKSVIIIAMAFVLLIPSNVYSDELDVKFTKFLVMGNMLYVSFEGHVSPDFFGTVFLFDKDGDIIMQTMIQPRSDGSVNQNDQTAINNMNRIVDEGIGYFEIYTLEDFPSQMGSKPEINKSILTEKVPIKFYIPTNEVHKISIHNGKFIPNNLQINLNDKIEFDRDCDDCYKLQMTTMPFEGAQQISFKPIQFHNEGFFKISDIFESHDELTIHVIFPDPLLAETSNSIQEQESLLVTKFDTSEKSHIPDWVKNIFGWYSQDQVSEEELLNAIKYLINEKILIVN